MKSGCHLGVMSHLVSLIQGVKQRNTFIALLAENLMLKDYFHKIHTNPTTGTVSNQNVLLGIDLSFLF